MLLQTIEEALRSVPYPARPEGLYEPIEYVLSMGGKRLRPTLLLLACGLYDEHPEKALPAAVGIETYHNHTLLHDDLMDRADMRRGQPTVHKKWNDNTAVLSGDTMLILAFRHVLRCNSPRLPEVLDLFARSAQEICEGQQYDVNFESRTDVTEAEYIEMIRLKTSVLLGCAVKMGALLGGAPAADADALYRFAEKVGLAFQLQDDYLDVYGDPAVFGKKIGVLVIILDMIKTALPIYAIWATLRFTPLNAYMRWGNGYDASSLYYWFAGLAAAIGHCWPLYIGFKGGKAVSCYMGTNILTSWVEFAFAGGTYLIVAGKKKMVSLASITTSIAGTLTAWVMAVLAMTLPSISWDAIFSWSFGFYPMLHIGWEFALVDTLIAPILIFRHRSNIKRILSGTEAKTTDKLS